MKEQDYDRDVAYWNAFYSNKMGVREPSPFAKFVYQEYLKSNQGNLLELGCGNGRDSIFFREKGIPVTAIDASYEAINSLQDEFNGTEGIQFICGDFVDMDALPQNKYCYSRFSIHAITEKQQDRLLRGVHANLVDNGYFFIEVRSVNDELYGKGNSVGKDSYIYNDHFRRFVRIGQLIQKMEDNGYIIDYAAERRGFAPYKDEDPFVIRVVGRKKDGL